MAGKKKPPAESPQPQEPPARRPRRPWINTGLAAGCVPSGFTGGLVALDKLHLPPSTTFKVMVLSPIICWFLGLVEYCVRAWVDRRTMIVDRETMIEEELVRTLKETAVQEAHAPVPAGQQQVTTVRPLRGGGYQQTRSTREVPMKPSPPESPLGSKSPLTPRSNGHISRRQRHRARGGPSRD